jgi:hypothetical protein
MYPKVRRGQPTNFFLRTYDEIFQGLSAGEASLKSVKTLIARSFSDCTRLGNSWRPSIFGQAFIEKARIFT